MTSTEIPQDLNKESQSINKQRRRRRRRTTELSFGLLENKNKQQLPPSSLPSSSFPSFSPCSPWAPSTSSQPRNSKILFQLLGLRSSGQNPVEQKESQKEMEELKKDPESEKGLDNLKNEEIIEIVAGIQNLNLSENQLQDSEEREKEPEPEGPPLLSASMREKYLSYQRVLAFG
jgi:hypothetical protein